jgi:hypothetical protein
MKQTFRDVLHALSRTAKNFAPGWMVAAGISILSGGCVSLKAPDVQIATSRGACIGVFWYSGLNSDQAATAFTRELIRTGFHVTDTTAFTQTLHRLGVNPSRMSEDALQGIRKETGADYLVVGSSFPLPGILDFPRAGMSVHVVDLRQGKILWKKVHGNSIWTGVTSTEAHVNRGATSLVRSLDEALGEQIKGAR